MELLFLFSVNAPNLRTSSSPQNRKSLDKVKNRQAEIKTCWVILYSLPANEPMCCRATIWTVFWPRLSSYQEYFF